MGSLNKLKERLKFINNCETHRTMLMNDLYGTGIGVSPHVTIRCCLGNKVIYNMESKLVKQKIEVLINIIEKHYCIKYKNKLRKWLWDIREKRAKEEFHPDKLREMLEGKDINEIDFE